MTGRADTGVDLRMGVGGTPEGIIAVAALTCMGGAIQARLHPSSDLERERVEAAGHDLSRAIREVHSRHQPSKLRAYAAIDFDRNT